MKTLKYLIVMLFIIVVFTACSKKPVDIILNKKDLQYPIYPVLDGWKPAKVKDVQAVAISVASVLMKNFPQKKFTPIIIENPKIGHPKILFKRGNNNEYIIWLNIEGRYWSQLAYQFSHELGHILSNYANENGENQWFDEALMETISLYTLEKMSIEWEHNPPYPNWKSYASSLKEYLEDMLKEKDRVIKEDLSIWYKNNKDILRKKAHPENNGETIVGTQIYDLVKLGKFKISTIQYLNLGIHEKNKSFSTYLREWYKSSPKENKESVLNVMKLFKITI